MTFKQAVRELLDFSTTCSMMPRDMGLCYNIAHLMSDGFRSGYYEAYHIMEVLLTDKEYTNGLGPDGWFTEQRIQKLVEFNKMNYNDYLEAFNKKVAADPKGNYNFVSLYFFGE